MSLKKIVLFLTCAVLAIALAAAPAAAQADKAKAKTKTEKAEAKTPPQKGMVWVNTASADKVYHKEGTRWYGKTKEGKWMTEDDAKKAGYREAGAPAAGKTKAKK
jgi:opacity protein-like surface antigen